MMVKDVSDVVHPYLTLPYLTLPFMQRRGILLLRLIALYGFTVLYTSAVGF